MNKKTTRGRNIQESIGGEILTIKNLNPDYSPGDILEELEKRHPKSTTLPKERGISNYLSNHRTELENMRSDLELKPWSLASLTQYELPTSSIPQLLLVQEIRSKENRTLLNIREAKWAGRIYTTIAALYNGKVPPKIASWIDGWAQVYATEETINKVILKEIELNTSDLDLKLIQSRGDCTKLKFLCSSYRFIHGGLSIISEFTDSDQKNEGKR